MELGRARVKVYGIVQGVFFRHNIRQRAQALGLKGWVRNVEDGSVEALFEGPQDKIQQMIKWCHKGPPGAVVERVEVQWEPYTGEFDDFRIRY